LFKEFNFHPIGSMARVAARAIVVYGHGVPNKNKVGINDVVPRSYLD